MTVGNVTRGRQYASNAEKQRAYRERLKQRRQPDAAVEGETGHTCDHAACERRVAELTRQLAQPVEGGATILQWEDALRRELLGLRIGGNAIDVVIRHLRDIRAGR